jgi:hypothetical protein
MPFTCSGSFFLDPDLDEARQYNIEAVAEVGSFNVWAAGSQAHLPGGDEYLAEATRIAHELVAASFPHLARNIDIPLSYFVSIRGQRAIPVSRTERPVSPR